jgi:signal transduction histidine kinase
VLVEDIRQYEDWKDFSPHFASVRSYLGAPIIQDGEVIGFLNLDGAQPGLFHPRQHQNLKAFADQFAIALGNANRFETARDEAAAEERQRLARELHDAVTQSLFSASVVAETLPMLTDRAEIEQGLSQLARLTKGALAEMRTLLIEMRPNALMDADLGSLLTHLINSHRARTKAHITFALDAAACNPPYLVKLNLYRIAQEALNNAAKHASATTISVTFKVVRDKIVLRVQDDGSGFSMDAVAAGTTHSGMGLRIMRERAASAEIAIQMTSAPDKGTLVEATWTKRM